MEISESNEPETKTVLMGSQEFLDFTNFKFGASGFCNFGVMRITKYPASLREVKIDPAGSLIDNSDRLDISTNIPIVVGSQNFINDSGYSSKLIPAICIDVQTNRIVSTDTKNTADPANPMAASDIVDKQYVDLLTNIALSRGIV